ncbi:MAG: PLP-dependent aminotransferase family protein [Pseudomonadota bacterium]
MSEILYDFGTGRSDPATFPVAALQQAAHTVLERDRVILTEYPGSLGYVPLRVAMARREGDREGVSVDPDQIALTNGSMQAVTLVAEALTRPGDTVITEDFTYPGTLSAYRGLGIDVQGVGMDAGGMRMDLLRDRMELLRRSGRLPKFIYVLTNYQNPSGAVMPTDRRQELLAIGREYATPIVEDNCYGDVHYAGDVPPALFALSDDPSIIYLGSLSKILAPGMRLGYLLAKPPMLATLLARRHDAGPNTLAAAIAAEFYADGIDAHCAVSNPPLHSKLRLLRASLESELGDLGRWSDPAGGLFLWLRYPDDVDHRKLMAIAEEAGVKYLPGISFHYKFGKAPFLRLAFGHLTEETIAAGVPVLADCIRRARTSNEAPEYADNWVAFD